MPKDLYVIFTLLQNIYGFYLYVVRSQDIIRKPLKAFKIIIWAYQKQAKEAYWEPYETTNIRKNN